MKSFLLSSLLILSLTISSCASKSGVPYVEPPFEVPDGMPAKSMDYYDHFDDIEWVEVGRSVYDQPIKYAEFGHGEDVMLFFSCFHGSESSTPRFGFEFANLLNENPTLVQSDKKVIVVPLLNPDGFDMDTRRNANNTDLNRNYPTKNWGQQPTARRSDGRRRVVYFGEAPASEPETQTVLKLMAMFDPDKIISVHQPLDCNNPDGPAGLGMAKLMGEYNGYELKEYIGFPTPGSYGTYAGKELEIPMVTLELPPGDPYTPEFDEMWDENWEALVAVVNCNLEDLE